MGRSSTCCLAAGSTVPLRGAAKRPIGFHDLTASRIAERRVEQGGPMSLLIKTTWQMQPSKRVEAIAVANEGLGRLRANPEVVSAKNFVSQFGDTPATLLVLVEVSDWEAFARFQKFVHSKEWTEFLAPHVSGPDPKAIMLSNTIYEGTE